MEGKLQSHFEKLRYFREEIFQIFLVLMENDKIVRVSDTVSHFHFPFQKVIEFVHVNVHQKLAGEIAQRQADGRVIFSMETSDHFT